MDTSLIKAINELTAAIDRNTRQLERTDPRNFMTRMDQAVIDLVNRSVDEDAEVSQEEKCREVLAFQTT